jgi:hypothetical protein
MQLELTDEEARAVLNLLAETIEADRYPFSPRIRCCTTSWRSLARWRQSHHRQPGRRHRRSGPGTGDAI